MGVLHPWRGPDGHLRLYFDECRADTYAPLAGVIETECCTSVSVHDGPVLAALGGAGFTENRRENDYEIPVARAEAPVPVPPGMRIITADRTELEPLMMLDCDPCGHSRVRGLAPGSCVVPGGDIRLAVLRPAGIPCGAR